MNNAHRTRSKVPRRAAGFNWLGLLGAFFVLLGACGAGNDDDMAVAGMPEPAMAMDADDSASFAASPSL